MNIHSLVKSIIKKYGTRNPFEIIKEKNAILVYAPLVDVRGFYQYFQRNNIIYIDENLSEREKTFVCAHELGHMFLHKKANAVYMDTQTCFNTNKYEIEANDFAINLLISDDMIAENTSYSLQQLSRLWGYDQKLIELRFKNIKNRPWLQPGAECIPTKEVDTLLKH